MRSCRISFALGESSILGNILLILRNYLDLYPSTQSQLHFVKLENLKKRKKKREPQETWELEEKNEEEEV